MNKVEFKGCCQYLFATLPSMASYWRVQNADTKWAAFELCRFATAEEFREAVDEIKAGKHVIEAYDRERLFIILAGRCRDIAANARAKKKNRQLLDEIRNSETDNRDCSEFKSWEIVEELQRRVAAGEQRADVMRDVRQRLGISDEFRIGVCG